MGPHLHPLPCTYTSPFTGHMWPCLFLLSSGRWVSGEPEAQRLSPVSRDPHPGQSDPQPCHLSSALVGMATESCQCPASPKHLNPHAHFLGCSSIDHTAGSRRGRDRTLRTQLNCTGLGGQFLRLWSLLPASGSPEPIEMSYRRLKCRRSWEQCDDVSSQDVTSAEPSDSSQHLDCPI